ncbi:MAG: lipase/acyltransferase domain-containing protein, partial [Rubrivivax sp.]
GSEDAAAPAERPAVFVIPGILGSHLKDGDTRIWLSLRLVAGLERLAWEPGSERVQPDGAIGMVYDDLMDHLAATHEVIEFAFDWRRPLEDEARRLAAALEAELDRRSASGQPVRILAHSMGGLLACTVQLEAPRTWERLLKREGARVLMLGTPNGGSWSPMQVLSGDDTFGNALAALGSPLRDRRARQLMAEMPGFIQLQADLLDPRPGLARSDTWRELADKDLAQVQEANLHDPRSGHPG